MSSLPCYIRGGLPIRRNNGFTIIELLIVIVIIAILAAITIVAYNGITAKATDARRAQDFSSIQEALQAYAVQNGGLPSTISGGSYTKGVVYEGWDASTSPNWLAFLRSQDGNMPTDPVNTIGSDGNPPGSSDRVYFYYCYPAGSGLAPATPNVVIGYHKSDGTSVTQDFPVDACL